MYTVEDINRMYIELAKAIADFSMREGGIDGDVEVVALDSTVVSFLGSVPIVFPGRFEVRGRFHKDSPAHQEGRPVTELPEDILNMVRGINGLEEL